MTTHATPPDTLADRLAGCHSGAVYDVLRPLGRPDRILPRTRRPLDPPRPLAGVIFTVSGHLERRIEEELRTENKVRAAILEGVEPVEAYPRHGKFQTSGETAEETSEKSNPWTPFA